jgi:hypothetical protein
MLSNNLAHADGEHLRAVLEPAAQRLQVRGRAPAQRSAARSLAVLAPLERVSGLATFRCRGVRGFPRGAARDSDRRAGSASTIASTVWPPAAALLERHDPDHGGPVIKDEQRVASAIAAETPGFVNAIVRALLESGG